MSDSPTTAPEDDTPLGYVTTFAVAAPEPDVDVQDDVDDDDGAAAAEGSDQ